MQSLKKFYFGKSKTTKFIGPVYAGANKYQGSCLAPNGKIYFAPRDSARILELDPSTGITTLVGSSYAGTFKWYGNQLASNGKIYFTPSNSTQILELSKTDNPNTVGVDSLIPSPVSNIASSNYNKYYNKF